jgi:hypothetical protein
MTTFFRVKGLESFNGAFDLTDIDFNKLATYTILYEGFMEGRHFVLVPLAVKQSWIKKNRIVQKDVGDSIKHKKMIAGKDASVKNLMVIDKIESNETSDDKKDDGKKGLSRDRRSLN